MGGPYEYVDNGGGGGGVPINMLIFEPSILHYYYKWHNLKFGMLNNQYSMCVVLLCSNCVARAFRQL